MTETQRYGDSVFVGCATCGPTIAEKDAEIERLSKDRGLWKDRASNTARDNTKLRQEIALIKPFAQKLLDDDDITAETLDYWAKEYLHAYDKLAGALEREKEIARLQAALATPEVYAGVVTEACEKHWAELIQKANAELAAERERCRRRTRSSRPAH